MLKFQFPLKVPAKLGWNPSPTLQELQDKLDGVNAALAKMAAWPFPVGTVPEPKAEQTEQPIRLCHVIYPSGGGVTIAYRKTSDMKNCRMVEVAVAYCSKHDTFSKKIGNAIALRNFNLGKTVVVPARYGNADYTITPTLKSMFTAEGNA